VRERKVRGQARKSAKNRNSCQPKFGGLQKGKEELPWARVLVGPGLSKNHFPIRPSGEARRQIHDLKGGRWSRVTQDVRSIEAKGKERIKPPRAPLVTRAKKIAWWVHGTHGEEKRRVQRRKRRDSFYLGRFYHRGKDRGVPRRSE